MFQEDLDKLTTLIRESGSKELQDAFKDYLLSLNKDLKGYSGFLKAITTFIPKERWDTSFVQE